MAVDVFLNTHVPDNIAQSRVSIAARPDVLYTKTSCCGNAGNKRRTRDHFLSEILVGLSPLWCCNSIYPNSVNRSAARMRRISGNHLENRGYAGYSWHRSRNNFASRFTLPGNLPLGPLHRTGEPCEHFRVTLLVAQAAIAACAKKINKCIFNAYNISPYPNSYRCEQRKTLLTEEEKKH